MFAVFAVAVVILYVLLISRFIKGWDETPGFEADKMPSQTPVTIITAFRNEEKNLLKLAQALDNQSYQNFEWILVDDNSADKSVEIIHSLIQKGFPGIKLFRNKGAGKKEAIRTAVYEAKNEWIITLDADVIPQKEWLLNLAAYLERFPSELLICPVKMTDSDSFFGKFQQFDFASLVASGAGAAKIGMPILCNGANMAFRKSLWLKNEHKLHFKEVSGDDIYLLQSVKKQHGVIRFLKSKKTIVETSGSETFIDFFRQRNRWAGKKAMYRDKDLLLTALIVFLTSFAVIGTAFFALFEPYYPSLFLLIFIAKFLTDTVLFWKISDFFGLKNVLFYSFIFSFIYPFYVVSAGAGSVFHKNKW